MFIFMKKFFCIIIRQFWENYSKLHIDCNFSKACSRLVKIGDLKSEVQHLAELKHP